MFLSILKLPSVSNVQTEPIVVQVDRLDLVLEENDDVNEPSYSSRCINRLNKLFSADHFFWMVMKA